ncbi:MAG TPA: hypothetical protein VJN18_01110 [Polyangiaceae bacterium]|nr:hypothetical protein [Polyangiaceae bacterium]
MTDDEADAALDQVIRHGAESEDPSSGEYYVLQCLISRWAAECLPEHRPEFRARAEDVLNAFCELEAVMTQASKAGDN